MPNREQVKTACQRCRERRSKCNGEQPCRRCEQNRETCEYNRKQWVSKSDLRAEIGRLKETLQGRGRGRGVSLAVADESSGSTTNPHQSSALEISTTNQTTLQGWINDIKTPDTEWTPAQLAAGENNSSSNMAFSSDSLQGDAARQPISPLRSSTTPGTPSCFDHLLSWRSCHPTFDQRNTESSSKRSSAEISPPHAPSLDLYGPASQKDTWTQTGWTRAHIRCLFDVLVTWDNIAFALLRKDEFLLDYEAGSTRFCSAALVYALLALSTRVISEREDDSGGLPSGWLGSRRFLHRAEALLRGQGATHDSLPDIQALGILALYHLRCGREMEARELTEACSSSIRELCSRDTAVDESNEEYFKVRATTYCGAMSQRRMLYLTTGILFNESGGALQDEFILEQLPCNRVGTTTSTANISEDTAKSLQLANPQLVVVKMFQLTEWVYKFIVANQQAHQLIPDEITLTYTKCLGWYRDLFELIEHGGSRTPFMLFIHMYYHFCLLCAFRPFVGNEFAMAELRPHDMCAQAVQSILSLAQSYDDLFTLRRVSALVPYFVCTAGLFSLAVEDSGAQMDFVHLRPQGAVHLPGADAQAAAGGIVPQASEAQIKVSTVTQARLLLSKMGATHLAAAIAEEKLTEGLRSWRRSSRPG